MIELSEIPPELLASRRTSERDLLEIAGHMMMLVANGRRGEAADRFYELEDASTDLQREAIALAATGTVAASRLAGIPDAAFTGAPRLFAWSCAVGACRKLGRRISHAHVDGAGVYTSGAQGQPFEVLRYMLAIAPRVDLGDRPLMKSDVDAFRAVHGPEATEDMLLAYIDASGVGSLWRDTEHEIACAEAIEKPRANVFALLLNDLRRRQALAWLEPVIASLQRGDALPNTATKLREAADILEGRTTTTRTDEGEPR